MLWKCRRPVVIGTLRVKMSKTVSSSILDLEATQAPKSTRINNILSCNLSFS